VRNWHSERKKLIERIDELIAQQGADTQECVRLRQRALDVVNFAGLGSNPIYTQVENLRREGFLTNLRERLELVPQLVKAFRRQRRHRKATRRGFPRARADSKGRARSVAFLYEELQILSPRLSSGEEYQKVMQRYRHFKVFEIVESRPKLQQELEQSESSRGMLSRAQKLAAHYHGKEVSTIETDWKHNKPATYRRRRKR
jgi:hypothetical protein